MVKVERYAIRQKSTGFYLPAPRGRGGRGGTHVEPCAADTPGYEPRLFHTMHAARVALTYWLAGRVTVSSYTDGWSGEYDESWYVEPVPGRVRDDMEVVAVTVECP